MGDEESDNAERGKQQQHSKAITKRQRQKLAARSRRQQQKQQRWLKRALRETERRRQQQEMQEVATNVFFDQLQDSTRQPEFEAAMSAMLQGLNTDSKCTEVSARDIVCKRGQRKQ